MRRGNYKFSFLKLSSGNMQKEFERTVSANSCYVGLGIFICCLGVLPLMVRSRCDRWPARWRIKTQNALTKLLLALPKNVLEHGLGYLKKEDLHPARFAVPVSEPWALSHFLFCTSFSTTTSLHQCKCSCILILRWAKMCVLKTDTRVSKCAF